MDLFIRDDSMFSLCGLNCGLCPMQIRGSCGGCFSGSPCYANCPIAPCSVRNGHVQYCYECDKYPCRRYDGIDKYDSLISHRNQKKDLAQAKEIGIEAYLEEQRSKRKLLEHLLTEYDDGNNLVFLCQAVNMLPLSELQRVAAEADAACPGMTGQEKTAHIVKELHHAADKLKIDLKLRKGW